MPEKDAARQEREMREHEREARERDPNPAPPGNIQAGGLSG